MSSKQYQLKRLERQHRSSYTLRNVQNDVGLVVGSQIKWFRWNGGKNAWEKIKSDDHPTTLAILGETTDC